MTEGGGWEVVLSGEGNGNGGREDDVESGTWRGGSWSGNTTTAGCVANAGPAPPRVEDEVRCWKKGGKPFFVDTKI